MYTIGLIYNPHVEAARILGEDILAWLTARQVDAWLCAGQESVPIQAPADLFVTLGGDGTILRTMQRAAPAGVPVLGINLGRVGFLTEASPATWQDVLTRILAGEGWVENRAMLRVTLRRDAAPIAQEDALNDAVISRGALARTMRLETRIDGAFVTRYVADGLILATATGSTAYAYAAGGPILPPWHNSFLLVPAAPHLSLERPLVLDADAVVEVKVNTEIPGMLTVDGRMEGELHNGDVVRVERSPLQARFLRLRNRCDFYCTLVSRLTPRNEE
ncbi:MAG: NAD(+)/NADH kinase [Anaerolineae bacterium]